jgi:hypothetical protein
MDYKLQVATLPVSEVDKAKTLCTESQRLSRTPLSSHSAGRSIQAVEI